MTGLQSCHMTQRIRLFYQLPRSQQKALLDLIDELLVMNRVAPPPQPRQPPALRAVK